MANAKFISYQATNSFSEIVIDYINREPSLRPFFNQFPDILGVQELINQQKDAGVDRNLLVSGLEKQYLTSEPVKEVSSNIEKLSKNNTFTITTAHQPNIFTGPLYFIYKILHVISLSEYLNKELSEYNFVPVFYMGSEDADIDELGVVRIDSKEYRWKTKQKGAVGRMLVDDSLLALVNEMQGQLGVLPFGNEILHHLRNCYSKGKSIEQATFEFIHFLFGKYGLVVVLPDNPSFKKIFLPIAEKEIREQFSSEATSFTIEKLSEKYKIQARGRDINLFLIEGDKRQRISTSGNGILLQESGTELSLEKISAVFKDHPEKISPNVLLRPLFQCMLLPDVVFTGGGGEIAYWLELKAMFDAAGIPFPVLSLRNSFLLLNEKNSRLIERLNLEPEQIFMKNEDLFRQIVVETTENLLSLTPVINVVREAYKEAMKIAVAVDVTLKGNVEKIEKHSVNALQDLEKKLVRAEKKKFDNERRQIEKLKQSLFPNGNLQERSESILGWYAIYGPSLIDTIYIHSKPFEHKFGVIEFK